MEDKGLQSSRWATKENDTRHLRRQVGTWNCHYCNTSIPLSRSSCPQCQPSPRQQTSPDRKSPRKSAFTTPASSPVGKGSPVAKGTPKRGLPPYIPEPLTQSNQGQLPGLESSRWAPKHENGGMKREIWTLRTVSGSAKVPMGQASSPIMPDLGLPYQVQHYILAMIQRILEEGCYEFAVRWMPQQLQASGWDCAEAVELSKWKAFLPKDTPPYAIQQVANYSLEAGLGDAVRIRNAAVHRHLCGTEEMRSMALQAKDLMVMFSDVSRQNKFYVLWQELALWEQHSRAQPVEARAQLERALMEISERPVDDMDWTPNVISLQKVADDGIADDADVVDRMDLD